MGRRRPPLVPEKNTHSPLRGLFILHALSSEDPSASAAHPLCGEMSRTHNPHPFGIRVSAQVNMAAIGPEAKKGGHAQRGDSYNARNKGTWSRGESSPEPDVHASHKGPLLRRRVAWGFRGSPRGLAAFHVTCSHSATLSETL